MTTRTPLPPSITEPEQVRFFDALYKRKRPVIADLSASATLTDVINKVNAILAADRASGQQES